LEVGKLPPAPTFAVHWLAVDGVQPSVPENPLSSSSATQPHSSSASSRSRAAGTKAETGLTRELQIYLDKVADVLDSAESPEENRDDRLFATLSALSNDAGLERLTPHLVRLVADRIVANLRNLPALWTSVRLAQVTIFFLPLLYLPNPGLHSKSLVRNSFMTNLDLYLHELCPALLTCALGKRLCASFSEDHWALRDAACDVLAEICARFGPSYADLQPRIAKTLAEGIQSLSSSKSRPLTTQYGGIVGLTKQGALVVDSVLVPLVCEGDFFEAVEAASSVDVNSEGSKVINTSGRSANGFYDRRQTSASQRRRKPLGCCTRLSRRQPSRPSPGLESWLACARLGEPKSIYFKPFKVLYE